MRTCCEIQPCHPWMHCLCCAVVPERLWLQILWAERAGWESAHGMAEKPARQVYFWNLFVVVWLKFFLPLSLCLDILQVPTCRCLHLYPWRQPWTHSSLITLLRRQADSWPICESFQPHPDIKVCIKGIDMAPCLKLLISPRVVCCRMLQMGLRHLKALSDVEYNWMLWIKQ